VTRLRLVLESTGGSTAGFVVPDEVVEELGGGRRPKVVATVGPHTWRSSIASMGGRFMLGMSKADRAAAGVEAGQTLDLEIVLDTAPRTVEPPEDLAAALAAEPAMREAWDRWPPSRQKEAARQLTEAKQPETRTRRLAKLVAELRG